MSKIEFAYGSGIGGYKGENASTVHLGKNVSRLSVDEKLLSLETQLKAQGELLQAILGTLTTMLECQQKPLVVVESNPLKDKSVYGGVTPRSIAIRQQEEFERMLTAHEQARLAQTKAYHATEEVRYMKEKIKRGLVQ